MKATECGDTDLVYLVLFHIWQKVIGLWKGLYFKCCQICDVYGVAHVSHAHIFVMMMQRQPLEFFGTIQARQLARDLFITYARYVPLNHFSKGKTGGSSLLCKIKVQC